MNDHGSQISMLDLLRIVAVECPKLDNANITDATANHSPEDGKVAGGSRR